MREIKKLIRFLSSMKFAIILLCILVAACAAGSLVTQGQSFEWYAARYSERAAGLIIALSLDDAYHSWWFILITAALCVNLMACNLVRMPQLMRRARRDAENIGAGARSDASGEYRGKIEEVFSRMHMPAPREKPGEAGRRTLYAHKNGAGYWGAWICHLGILLLIAGFGLGQATQRQYTVFGVPGQLRPIADTGYVLSIDDFRIDRREDGSVDQYTSNITVYDVNSPGGLSESAEISVNNPATLYGMKLYQNSTGWAADIDITKDGEPLQHEPLCVGESLAVSDKPELVVLLSAFYPDYVKSESGRPATASDSPDNPAYLYTVYFQNQILGMNVLIGDEPLTIDEYTVTFSAPQPYTLIQIKVDRFTWLALVGGIAIMLGLILAFYVQPQKLWAVERGDGAWDVYGACQKGGVLFRERLSEALKSGDTAAGETASE